ncbi:MAG: exodeoxyribonuclease VII large subunit [Parachlamydiales bacterium]|nr:exodeoxyribonuclease VII large subunit [Parachlamydiales bacterium]
MQTTSNTVLTVSELTIEIKNLLEGNFRYVSLKGEISNFKKQSSGHLYFSLKDENAQIFCAMFKGNAYSLASLPKDGDQVIIEGEISVYPPRGNYQIIVRKLSFSGVGQLLLKLHELKEKLKNLGWFEKDLKKKLPLLPKKIGVVTSPTGAAIQDILNILKRRFSNFHLILNPVKVQGEGAKEEIAQAINQFNEHNLVDVIIVGRGGGSIEDLWAFNEEIVAKAIFESKIPIISAVGHETDITISDYVADKRAPTPSAAAEIVLKEKKLILDSFDNYKNQLYKNLSYYLKSYRQKLENFSKNPYLSSTYTIFGSKIQQLDEIKPSIEIAIKKNIQKQKELLKILSNQLKNIKPQNQIKAIQDQLKIFKKRLILGLFAKINLEKERFFKLINHLKSIDPKNLLKKGYSICFNEKTSSIILSIKDIAESDKFSVLLSDGKIYGVVKEKK